MTPSELDDYSSRHRNTMNLLVHIAAVPLFIAGVAALAAAVVFKQIALIAVAVALVVYSLLMQRWGHGQEAVPPEPSAGPSDAIIRLLREQFITFPRFVLSGRWRANLEAAKK
jgi:hypothetical protein